MLTYLQAVILGISQGVAELFPVSSLGHSILIADLFGWTNLVTTNGDGQVVFVNSLAMMHVATATALIIFYRTEWIRIGRGIMRSLHVKKISDDTDAKLGWLLLAATVPTGLVSILLGHKLKTLFDTSFFAIIFIICNGILLIKGDKLITKAELARPRNRSKTTVNERTTSKTARAITNRLTPQRAMLIGVAQIGAFCAGISRSGAAMLVGLRSGLSHQDAARFSFLLATPLILGAGVYKLPSVISSGAMLEGPIVVGSLLSGIGAYLSVRFLDNYFRNKSLRPFGIYCIAFGLLMLLVAIWRGTS